MADVLTACLKSDAATVKAVLTAAPFNHVFVAMFGDFTDGNLTLMVCPPNDVPDQLGGLADVGTKVVLHTRSP